MSNARFVIADSAANPVFNIIARSVEPTSANEGDVYLDDGTNTASTDPAFRLYTAGAWEDLGGGAGGGSTLPVADTTAVVKGSADATKLLRFEVDGFTTATTRVATPPDEDFTMVGVATSQTLANKVLSQLHLIIGGFKAIFTHAFSADRTVTLPGDANVTLLGADTTQTVTNKTLDADNNTISNIGAAEVKADLISGQTLITTVDGTNDRLLIWDATDSLLKEVAPANLPSGGGGATVVTANKLHKFASNQTTTSVTMTDVDATNAAITATLTGSGKALVSFNFATTKATAGSGYFRITDGTNNSTEWEIVFPSGLIVGKTLSWLFDTTAGSTTYKLQFRSSDANSVLLYAFYTVEMHIMEIA